MSNVQNGNQGPGFYVMRRRCAQCLYGPRAIVPEERRDEIIRGLKEHDSWFICHKASILGREVACHGDWQERMCGQLGRIMFRIGMIKWIDEADIGQLPDKYQNSPSVLSWDE